jgi:hypothetical protein
MPTFSYDNEADGGKPPTVHLATAEGQVMAREAALPIQHPTDRLVGHTPAIQALRAQIRHLAAFDAVGNPSASTVLLQHKLLTTIEAKRIRRPGREKAVGWPNPQFEVSTLFSPGVKPLFAIL